MWLFVASSFCVLWAKLLLKELRTFDDLQIFDVILDRSEVFVVFCDDTRLPTSRARGEQSIERHPLRRACFQLWQLAASVFPTILRQPEEHFACEQPIIRVWNMSVLSPLYTRYNASNRLRSVASFALAIRSSKTIDEKRKLSGMSDSFLAMTVDVSIV